MIVSVQRVPPQEGMDLRNRTVGLAYGRSGKFEDAVPAYAAALRTHLQRDPSFRGDRAWCAGGELTACDFVLCGE